ncbi:RNA-binding protein NOB1 [Anopheles bellator]|uniref:RNA-binding protein NOB1 n=1 Tax=Anopheles bellator TaxID=139047 RepID=UPI002648B9A2|nr:RNA-binding protein NOB1 [Anopheles bellator]
MSKFQHLIVDTSAFIKNVQLQTFAENCYTVQGVLDEIRNDRQLKALTVLPYSLRVKEPDPDVVAKVVAFAKKTGDYASLSMIDLRVIALTYELETVHVGRDHLKEEPKAAVTVTAATKPKELLGSELTKGFYAPSKAKSERQDSVANDSKDDGHERKEHQHETDFQDEVKDSKGKSFDTSLLEATDELCDVVLKQSISTSDDENSTDPEECSEASEEEDNDEGWITPSNIQQVKRDYGQDCLEETVSPVACMTTDFAMQNVLKQIGLKIAALDGRVIRQSRTYILRCYACFKTTPDATKVFCPKCGNRTLKKVAVSLNPDGQQIIHINSRRALTAKYKNQPVAKFEGGKHATNPLLYEDQPLPQQRISNKARSKTNALGDDYIAGFSPFVMRDVDSRSAVLRGSSNLKQRMTNLSYDNKRRGYRK